MAKAHLFSEQIFGDNRNEMETHLRACNAFSEPEENKLKIIGRL
jgi:hypothetical protein